MESIREAFGVPEKFSIENGGIGYLMSSCGNCSVITANIAKMRKIKSAKNPHETVEMMKKLVGYFPDVSHSHAVKALSLNNFGEIREIPSRFDEVEGNFKMNEKILRETIEEDIKKGFIPALVMAVIGATPTGGNDDLVTIGKMCKEFDAYMLVDAAYAGCFFVVPELRHYIKGLEYADGYIFNPSKMMLTGLDCSVLFVNDMKENALALGIEDFNTERPCVADLKMGDTTRGGLFKTHFMLQEYGIEGMQRHILDSIDVAKYLEELIKKDER